MNKIKVRIIGKVSIKVINSLIKIKIIIKINKHKLIKIINKMVLEINW